MGTQICQNEDPNLINFYVHRKKGYCTSLFLSGKHHPTKADEFWNWGFRSAFFKVCLVLICLNTLSPATSPLSEKASSPPAPPHSEKALSPATSPKVCLLLKCVLF